MLKHYVVENHFLKTKSSGFASVSEICLAPDEKVQFEMDHKQDIYIYSLSDPDRTDILAAVGSPRQNLMGKTFGSGLLCNILIVR